MSHLHVYILIFPALSTGGYAGQVQGAYGKRFKDGAALEMTLCSFGYQTLKQIETLEVGMTPPILHNQSIKFKLN